MREFRLGSSKMVFAPGVIKWAVNGYHFPKDRPQLRKVVTETWKIPEAAAVALLEGADYHLEDAEDGEALSVVVFEADVPEDE